MFLINSLMKIDELYLLSIATNKGYRMNLVILTLYLTIKIYSKWTNKRVR